MAFALKLVGNPPLIDSQKLQLIRDLGEPDDADGFFRDLLGVFFERVPRLLLELEAAIKDADCHRTEQSAHALKGTAGHLGAIWLMELAAHLEVLGREKNLEGADHSFQELKRVYPLTKQELESHWL